MRIVTIFGRKLNRAKDRGRKSEVGDQEPEAAEAPSLINQETEFLAKMISHRTHRRTQKRYRMPLSVCFCVGLWQRELKGSRVEQWISDIGHPVT